jgi:hypothetical protein
MGDIDKIIYKLFSGRWTKDLSEAPIEDMRKQLHKNLQNQIDGYWTGHTAYHICVDGGFLIDSKRKRIKDTGMAEGKKLTVLGKVFMDSMNKATNIKE